MEGEKWRDSLNFFYPKISLTVVLLNPDLSFFENTVIPDQLAPRGAL